MLNVITPFPRNDAPLGARPGASILLAEDNEANIQIFGGYLENIGYAMHYASNGAAAVAMARALRPALILMDVQMPVMDGLTAIEAIREDPTMEAVPIVALTALARPADRLRCLEAGATDFMSKPVSLKALAQLVDQLLAQAEAKPNEQETLHDKYIRHPEGPLTDC